MIRHSQPQLQSTQKNSNLIRARLPNKAGLQVCQKLGVG
jgi:hypothetical protein